MPKEKVDAESKVPIRILVTFVCAKLGSNLKIQIDNPNDITDNLMEEITFEDLSVLLEELA